MNNLTHKIKNIVLATATMLIGLGANAQTAITSDNFWPGTSEVGQQMTAWGTFGNDHFYKQGPTRTANYNQQVTVNGVTYPTYDLRDAQNDAIKMVLGQGEGKIRVYYNDTPIQVTRTVNRCLRVNDSNVSLNGNTTRNDDLVTFPEAWNNNGITWSFPASDQFKLSSFTLNLPNDNISGDIARVRIVFRFHNGVEEMQDSQDYTASNTNQSITLNVDNDHKDAYLREIYIQNNSAGQIRVGDCLLTGTVTEPQRSSHEVTTELRPTDSNVTRYGNTTVNGSTVNFDAGWTGFGWNISNTTTKLTRVTLTMDNSGFNKTDRAPVRIVVRYRGGKGAESVSNPVNYLWSEDAQNGNITLTVTPQTGTEDYYIREIFIQNGAAGSINITSAQLVTQVETSGNETPVLKRNQTDQYSPLTYTTGEGSTKIMEYSFNNSGNTDFWLSGGQIGAIEVDFDDTTIITAPDLVPITSDFLWYYNGGGGLYNSGYTNNSRMYRYLHRDVINAENTEVLVNGIVLDNDGSTSNASKHSYRIGSHQALGFKLDANKKYRIRILADQPNVLYKGNTAMTSTQVTASNAVTVLSSTGQATNPATYLTTYEITGSGDTYWIRYPSGNLNLGGFEVLPIENNVIDMSTKPVYPAASATFWFDDYMENHTNECGSLNSMQLLRSGNLGTYVYMSGPDMPMHNLTMDTGDHRALRVNNGTKVGFRIPAGMTLSITFTGDSGSKLMVTHNGAGSSQNIDGLWNTYTHTSTTEETVWFTSNDANYLLIAGFKLEPVSVAEVNPDDDVAITNDYIWYAGEDIAQEARFGSGYIANNGVAKRTLSGDEVTVDGRSIGVYDLSRAGESFRLKVADNTAGEIRVFWEPADLAVPELLDLSAYQPTFDWADFYHTSSNSGQTITFAYTTGQTGLATLPSATEWPARGYQLPHTLGKYDQVTVNLASNNPGGEPFRWHVIPLYENGAGGNSEYTTGLSYTADIDPERVLTGFVIQGSIDANVTKSITVGSVVFNRLGTAAGTVQNTTLWQYNAADGQRQIVSTDADPIDFAVEGTNYISYKFDGSADRTYYIKGGFVSAIEVLIEKNWDNIGSLTTLPDETIKNVYTWNVASGLGTTINNGEIKMVLNGSTVHDNSHIYIYGNGDKFYGVTPKTKNDLAINDKVVNDQRTVLLDKYHAIGIKLPQGGQYKVTAYWAKCDNKGGIRFEQRTDGYSREPAGRGLTQITNDNIQAVNSYIEYSDYGPSSRRFDLRGVTDDQFIWIAGNSADPVYFSGIKVEVYKDYSIEFKVTDQQGIFTGKYKRGDDIEEKLLIYCTDNGTYESFRVPQVWYRDATDSSNDKNITVESNPNNSNKPYYTPENLTVGDYFKLPNASNCNTPAIVADGSYYKVTGFEDTDNDRIWKITYTYPRTYTEDGQQKTEEISDYYYIWYANYLKVGWWTNREAKLIVGKADSASDPDHIIVGEFYVSAGEVGDLYYDVINPGQIPVSYQDGDETKWRLDVIPGYEHAKFTRAWWTYTGDNENQVKTGERKYTASDFEWRSGNKKKEEFHWSKMNDHKNHLGDAIQVAYPVSYNASDWSSTGGEVVKTITFTAERAGWPDWTAKLTFHFVPAPTIERVAVAGNSAMVKKVKMTRANPSNTQDTNIYYTTDGNVPTFDASGNPTNQTYVYNDNDDKRPVNRQTTIYLAAERVYKTDAYYIHNPYTTYIEGKTMNDLMTESSNRSNYFVSVSKEFEAPIVDALIEYVDQDRNIIKMNPTDYATTTKTSYNEWGESKDPHSVSALGLGGFLYKYPFAEQRRDVMVLFGNATKRVYRENAFKNVGVYWGRDDNDAFAEHFDFANYKWKTMGYNYDADHGGNTGDAENGNPQTECNSGIGGANTEGGGLWLQPISGDFLRFEPEYDGVITVWIRHNGAAQGDEYYGNITRRPVYVVDENGKVMPRSTVKPTQDEYFGIDGLYGEICANRSTVRHDCRTDWVNGLSSWKRGYENNDNSNLPLRNMATFRLYNYWYGFPMFQNQNRDGHNVPGTTDPEPPRHTMDVADSWISRTANVKSVICGFNSILYHSEQLHSMESQLDFEDQTGAKKYVNNGDKFAKYGWEIPSFNVVRYRFPVKAGKSYYMGGRGTKNGYMGMKFEPLPANYNPRDYRNAGYRSLYEQAQYDQENRPLNKDAYSAYDDLGYTDSNPGYDRYAAGAAYSDATARSMYDAAHTIDMGAVTNNNQFKTSGADDNSGFVPTYDLWEQPPTGKFNSWYGQYGVDGHANVLFQDKGTYWENGQRALIRENAVVGHTCNVRLTRKFTKGYWHPIILPFSVSESRMKEIFGDKVQVLYLDPFDNTMRGKNNTEDFNDDRTNDPSGLGYGSSVQTGQYVSALNPAIAYANLRFTYHHYQMLYANVPAFICPDGKRMINGNWDDNWTTIGTDDNTKPEDAIVFERVCVDRTNITDNSYDKIGYKIGETGDWEYWVTGSYTPGFKGAPNIDDNTGENSGSDGIYYLSNEIRDQDGEQKYRATIYHSPNGKTMKATRCWIAVRKKANTPNTPWGVPPRLTTVGFGSFDGEEFDIYDNPSGIADIVIDEDRVLIEDALNNDESVYDVMGRKVGYGTTEGLPSGVYIMRGQKVYVK